MKAGKIAVVAMAILLTMMVGYALFSESININGTASAKGEFDYSVECSPGLTNDVPDTYENIAQYSPRGDLADKEGGYVNDTCSVSDKIVTLSTDLQYPTANRMFTVKITNTGSIDMKFDVENFDMQQEDFINDISNRNTVTSISFDAYYVDGNMAMENPETTIEPGKTAIIVLSTYWSDNININTNDIHKTVATFTMPFVQAN